MPWLPPLDHSGRAIPVPPHHLFSWRKQGIQLLLSLLIWMALWFALLIIVAAFKTRDLALLAGIVPDMAAFAASLAALFSFLLVVTPQLVWPWTRRGYGRELEARIEQMSISELGRQIEQCDLELDSVPAARKRAAIAAWRDWLEGKRVERVLDGASHRLERLTLRPSRRKLIISTASGGIFLAVGLWFIVLAIVGGDGGTGIAGFSGPNAAWAKSIIGGLLVLGTTVPILEAFTVRVDLTAVELRKQGWGRTLWSIPTDNVSLALGDDGAWQVLDADSQKRIGELNPHHFEDSDLLDLIGRFRPVA